MTLLRILMIVTVATCLGACGYKEPGVVLRDGVVSSRSDNGLVISFDLEMTNSNDVPLPLREVRYSVFIDGRRVFDGVRSPEATLAAVGTHAIALPASIESEALRRVGDGGFLGEREVELRGKLLYVTPGRLADLLFDNGVRVPKKAFGGRAMVDLDRMPPDSGEQP